MKITLIRHGISTSNELKVYTGHTDVSLSENGVKDLKMLREKVEFPKADVYISSPLKRCIETFEILYPDYEINHMYDDLRETNFGDWEGMSYENLKDDPDYIKWIENIEYTIPPNGENFIDFKKRVINAFNEIIEFSRNENHKNVVIMTHGGVIRAIMSELVDVNVHFFNWEIPNGLGYELTIENNKIKYKNLY